jgi:hypothetical protein
MPNINEIIQFIRGCSKVERERIIDALNERRDDETREAKSQFHVRQLVEFRDKDGILQRGQIVKMNPKTIKVKVGHMTWRVSPQLLKPLVNSDGTNPA